MSEPTKNPWPTVPLIWAGIGVAYAIYFNLHIG